MKSWPRAILLAVFVLAASAVPANAGLLVSSVPAASCNSQVLEQPFTRWLDPFKYTLVPRGNFESGTSGWKLTRASVVTDNESFYVRSSRDTRSLSLGSSGIAESPAMCATIFHPTLRFFARNRGNLLSLLTVEVLFETSGGKVAALPIGVVVGGSKWQPTLPTVVIANLLALLPNERTALAFRFRATGLGGDWRIDDVFLDPHRRR